MNPDKFARPIEDATGRRVLTAIKGPFSNMMMDIDVWTLKAGTVASFGRIGYETAVLLIQGDIVFSWDGNTQSCHRSSFINEGPYVWHGSTARTVTVKASQDSEILVQSTDNPDDFGVVFYDPSKCSDDIFGKNQFGGMATRTVRTVFDYSIEPRSKMVMGEVIHGQGKWTSFIPHHHPQPEVYYYRFDKSSGFGASFVGDDAFRVTDRSISCITPMCDHPQVCAPGYRMYYVWLIRHLDSNPWEKTRIDNPEHTWMLDADFSDIG